MKKTVWIRNFLQKMYDRESFFYKFVEWTSDIRFQLASWVWEQDCLETILSLLKEDGEVEISLGTSYEEYITTVEVSKKVFQKLVGEKSQKAYDYKVLPSKGKDTQLRARLERA